MNEQAMKASVGIFVVAAVIFLFVLAMLFGGFPQYFQQADTYTILLDDATGISAGTPVRKSGVKVGEVRSLKLDNATGQVSVIIEVDKGFTVRDNDVPTVIRGLLGGDTSIDFVPSDEVQPKLQTVTDLKLVPVQFQEIKQEFAQVEGKAVPPGTTLKGKSPPDAARLVEETRSLISPARETLVEMQQLLNRIEKMTPLMENTIKEYNEVAKSINRTVPEIRRTNDELQDLIKLTKQTVPGFNKTNEELQELIRLTQKTVPEIKRTGEEIQATARTWNKVGERVDLLIQTNEDRFVKMLKQSEEVLQGIANIITPENQKYVNQTLKNVALGSEHLDPIGRDTEKLIAESRTTIANLNKVLLKADDALSGLEKFGKPFGERGPIVMKNFEDTSVLLNKTLLDVRQLLAVVGRSDGTVSKLIEDPSLYNNLNEAAGMVTKILPRLDRILYDVEIFSDKIARRPEQLGIGGVVRPSTGVKESPSVIPWRVVPGNSYPDHPTVIPWPAVREH